MNGAAFDDLWYASDATGSWVTKGIYVHPSHRTGLYTAIAVDINDDIHIVNHNTVNDGDLYYETIQGYVEVINSLSIIWRDMYLLSFFANWAQCRGRNMYDFRYANHATGQHDSYYYCNLFYRSDIYWRILSDRDGSNPSNFIPGTPFILTKDAAISTISPTNTGGAATSWSISPAEPTGLTFDTSTGELTGTPTILQISPATYTITATNTGGTDTTTISLSIVDEVPEFLIQLQYLT